MHSQNTHMLIDEHICKRRLIFYFHCVSQDSSLETLREEVELEFRFFPFISQSMLIFRSNSYNWWIKHQVLLSINAVQTLSLKEPLRMKTILKYQRLGPLIFLSPASFLLSPFSIPLLPAGEYWQSVKDSAATVDLSYLQAQRRRLRRDSDNEAVSAIASLSMGSLISDR